MSSGRPFRGGPGRGAWRGAGRGTGRGTGRDTYDRDQPPDTVVELGSFMHAVEDEMLCASTLPDKVPYFNAPIYLQNKAVIGKVDEILGPINEVYFSVKMGEGMVASSFKKGEKVYVGGDKLLPLERFLPRPKISGGVKKRGRGGGRGNAGTATRGARGFQQRGGRGMGRGAPRGGFNRGQRGMTRGGRGGSGFRGGRGYRGS